MKYESYPVYLSEDEYVDFWRDYFKHHELKDNEDISLYIHYPWCRSVCKFCVFGALKYDDHKSIINQYEQATLRLIEKMRPIIEPLNISELFFGGGTPSLWSIESLEKMTTLIPNYDNIGIKRTEVHPFDMSKERMDFMINIMKFDHVSMGIQSFNENACRSQNRIHVSPEKLSDVVKYFQAHGIYVNCDLVAMFDGLDEKNWDIFKDDIQKMSSIVHPDCITLSPNYREDYYNISIRFRQILKEFLPTIPDYHLNYGESALSLDKKDIIKFVDRPYLVLTKPYAEFVKNHFVLRETKTKKEMDNRNMIAFGGINKETAFSRTSEFDNLTGEYIPFEDEFIYVLTKRSHFDRMNSNNINDLISHDINIGQNFILPPPPNNYFDK